MMLCHPGFPSKFLELLIRVFCVNHDSAFRAEKIREFIFRYEVPTSNDGGSVISWAWRFMPSNDEDSAAVGDGTDVEWFAHEASDGHYGGEETLSSMNKNYVYWNREGTWDDRGRQKT